MDHEPHPAGRPDPATLPAGAADPEPRPGGETTAPYPGAAEAIRPPAPALPAGFGRYLLLRILGKGGMGAVYLAHDTQLDRQVALKVPSFGPGDDPALRERFLREARAAATLSHPNICPVYDVGEVDGVPYLTMALIEGRSLADILRKHPQLPAPQAAALVRQLALAMQEAHERGVIHRDLKPANIMINRRKQVVIMDFGLARRGVDAESMRLTQSGAVLGTPAYMPPEQVDGDVQAMGPGCDIYSLGVILYELLAGRRPFEGPLGSLMAQIMLEPPPPLARFRPDIDPALEANCRKALAKKPADRFATMAEFAAALADWLARMPTTAPAPAGPAVAPAAPAAAKDEDDTAFRVFAEIAAREQGDAAGLRPDAPARRSPSRRLATIAIAATLALGLAAVAFRGRRAGELARPSQPTPVAVAKAPKPPAPAVAPAGEPPTAPGPSDAPPAPPSPARADVAEPPRAEPPAVGAEGEPRDLKPGEAWRFDWPGCDVRVTAFSPDGRRLLAAGDARALRLWDAEARALLREVPAPEGGIDCAAFTPDGRRFLTGGGDGVLRVWEATTGEPVRAIEGHGGAVTCLAISPDGRLVVSAGADKGLRLRDLAGGDERHRLEGPGEPLAVAFTPDGAHVLIAGGDRTIRQWDVKTGRAARLRSFEGPAGPPRGAWFLPGRREFLADSGRALTLWALAGGKALRQLDPGEPIDPRGLAASPDGLRLLTGHADGSLRLRELHGGAERLRLDLGEPPRGLAIAPDGRLAAAGGRGVVHLVRLPDPPAPVPTPAEQKEARRDVASRFQKDYEAAARATNPEMTRRATTELTRKLWAAGREARDRPTRFALWSDALARARQAGMTMRAFRLIEEMAGQFALGDELAPKERTLKEARTMLASPPLDKDLRPSTDVWRDANRELAEAALGTAEDALAVDDFDAAARLLRLAAEAARRLGGDALLDRVRAREAEARALRSRRDAMRAAAAALRDNADDPDANLKLGRLLALSAGDWERALPHLAKGGDPSWAAPAGRELARPTVPADCLALGDAWWALADALKDRARARLYWHACDWYERALPGLPAAARDPIERKIRAKRGEPNLGRLEPLVDARLDDPKSGFPRGPWKGGNLTVERGYDSGTWSLRIADGNGWYCTTVKEGNYRCNFACELAGRVSGPRSEGWGLTIVDADWAGDMNIGFDSDGALRCNLPWNPQRHPANPSFTARHRLVRPHGEFNRLLVVLQGRRLEFYVNGEAIRDPILLDRDLSPYVRLRIGLAARGRGARVEFERLRVWLLDALPGGHYPTLEERAAALRPGR
jgi:hypothetical protein